MSPDRNLISARKGGPDSATRPLVAAGLVSLDCETTGLDIFRDRLIQLGGVRIRGGQVDREDRFETLVNPEVDIPPASFAVHGISRDDLAGAPDFGGVAGPLADWLGPSLVVGFSVGFDIAILRREHALAEIPWEAPGFLDIALLARRVMPALPDYALDTVAARLGITVTGRHSAIGDALAAAEIFVALLPALRQGGIRTVGEALRVCQESRNVLPEGAPPPWERVSEAAGEDDPDEDSLPPALDAGQYRLRVADLMTTNPEVMPANRTAGEALSRMMARGVSSVFLGDGQGGTVRPEASGIVTERDILRAIDRQREGALELPLESLATRPLESIHGAEFVYRAAGRMSRQGFRHLAVHDDGGTVTGAISARDLLKGGDGDALNLDDSIDLAETPEALGRAWSALAPVSRSLLEHGVDVRDIAEVVSHELCSLTRRACELAEAEMEAAGHGRAPRPWAMLVLGSGGRGESLLAMDQDNAIVYADGEHGTDDGEADRWFAELGARVSYILDLVGVPYCKGGVMAMNGEWRRTLSAWQDEVGTWVRRRRPEDILNVDIFYDARVVHGDRGLGASLLDQAFRVGAASREFLTLLKLNACRFDSAIGILGRLKLEEGRLDVKKSGLLPVFSAARVLAIQEGIRVRSTRGRLESAMEELARDDPMREVHQNLLEVHRIVLASILGQQVRDMSRGVPPSNRVAPAEMTAPARQRLKWALDRVDYVSNLLGDPLGRG